MSDANAARASCSISSCLSKQGWHRAFLTLKDPANQQGLFGTAEVWLTLSAYVPHFLNQLPNLFRSLGFGYALKPSDDFLSLCLSAFLVSSFQIFFRNHPSSLQNHYY